MSWIPKWHEIYEAVGLNDAAYSALSDGEIAVHFLDVGQGDCALILTGGKNVLIDAGEASAAPDVIRYLNSLEIRSLDLVIATHPHSDHIGGLSGVIGQYSAETLLLPELSEEMTPATSSYRKLLEAAEDCGAAVEYVRAGESRELAEGCWLEFVAPVREYDDLNNSSITARLVYGDTSFLFTGDIEQEAERDIYESGACLSSNVIKIAHHGSSTSSLKVFLQAADPEYAVISVGSPNDYGHPHEKTLKLLELLGITVYRTDLDGNIVWISDGKTLRVNTSKERAA